MKERAHSPFPFLTASVLSILDWFWTVKQRNMDPKTTAFSPKPPQDRGAGGKLRKPPSRRPEASPYARPQQNQPQRGRWISKLVDPAFRLVYGGANLILPSFFSKLRSGNALPAPSTLEENHEVEEQCAVADDGNLTENNVEASATQIAGSSCNLDVNGQGNSPKTQVPDPDGLSEIERLLKDKNFSRVELNHLIEIINSRVDHSDVEQENTNAITKVGDLRGSGAIDHSRKPIGSKQEELDASLLAISKRKDKIFSPGISSGSKQDDLDASLLGTSKHKDKLVSPGIPFDAGKPILLENTSGYNKECNEDLDRFMRRPSTPLLPSKVLNDIGSSPIDIARAYMQNRASEVGIDTNSSFSKDEETTQRNELVAKPSPVPRSIPRWPGALVQEQHDYMTPQTQRTRFGLQNFPRTPYSRSIHSRTKSRLMQLQGSNDRRPSITATPFQYATTPSEQVHSKNNASNSGHGSAGPIRRARHKFNAETPARVSVNFNTSLNSAEHLSIPEGLLSVPKKDTENGQINGSTKYLSFGSERKNAEVSTISVPAHSSQVARKILEHLERNPPTPKDKSAELRLASSWKKSQHTSLPTFMPNKLNGPSNLAGFDSPTPTQGDRDHPLESANTMNAVVSSIATTSGVKFDAASTQPSQEPAKALTGRPRAADEDISKVSSRLPPRSASSAKPMLPAITIDKPVQRWARSSDNSSGFTFPVSAASGGSLEPPTPTMPTFSVVPQSEGSAVPSFSFGTRKSTPPLVFSFPSTSSSAIVEEASELKFKFGSEEPRISFAAVG